MKIIEYWTELVQGYLHLKVRTDLGLMTILPEQKWFEREGLLFTGKRMEDVLPEIKLPSDPRDGRAPLTLRGFTADPRIVELYRKAEAGLI